GGYKTYSKQIEINEQNVLFKDIVLQQVELVTVTVKSIPIQAQVFVDNLLEGNTDKQFFKYPGTYNLRLVKGGFDTIDESITITEESSNTFSYSLEKSSITLTLAIDPSDAEVKVDNQIRNTKTLELAPGVHKVEISKEGYETATRQITLSKGSEANEVIKLNRNIGKLLFTVVPIEARINLNSGESWVGANKLVLPTGEYTGTATANTFSAKQFSFIIGKDQDTVMDIVMEKEIKPTTLSTEPLTETSVLLQTTNHKMIDMVFVPGDTFEMGGGEDALALQPIQAVSVSSFYIGKYEVSQIEWLSVMGDIPARFQGENLPIENVNWYECIEFCNRLSELEGLTPCYSYYNSGVDTRLWPAGWKEDSDKTNYVSCDWTANGYRLPTEAEWEFAAREGSRFNDLKYSGSNSLGKVAWYESNSKKKTHPVGTKSPNVLDIYDMTGNVWEWVWDFYETYTTEMKTDPHGPESGSSRLWHGGSWNDSGTYCRISYQNYGSNTLRREDLGFRVARNAY
ncbi:MAG: SUMF1/EgtB/PvdO family nonheme iron enzyme, partial [Candidatus Cloacimonetes bacterium]|nr:SUMF1/EgtB/PvdO family nonheme iron enzyme [Candidatus Cloacimonadota bacterium]